MIHEIAKELGVALRARGVPLRVVDGPERAPVELKERVVLERDRDGGDTFGPTRSVRINPKMRFTRAVGCVARIYAKSTVVGATVSDHERRAETILDRVVVGLDNVIRGGARKTFWVPQAGKFVTPPGLEDTETWPVAVYEFRFAVDRGVFDRDWPTASDPQGAAKPQSAINGIDNTLNASLPGGVVEVIPFGKVD